MTNEDRRAKPEDRSAFTPEVRERLEHVARRWPSGMRVGTQSDWLPATPYDVVCALTHIDALEARVAELEGKALAYDDLHAGDYLERAHALAQTAGVQAIGRNVWHVAVEQAEHKAVLAAECRAWRMYNRAPDTGAAVIVKETVAAVDAAGALEGGRS